MAIGLAFGAHPFVGLAVLVTVWIAMRGVLTFAGMVNVLRLPFPVVIAGGRRAFILRREGKSQRGPGQQAHEYPGDQQTAHVDIKPAGSL